MDRWTELLSKQEYAAVASMPFPEARAATAVILENAIAGLPSEVLELLPDLREIDRIRSPAELAEEMDIRYFDFNDEGNEVEAKYAFSGARILSACDFFQKSVSIFDLMEAIYEAEHSKIDKTC